MAFIVGFLPWVLYWVLIGNIDFRLALGIALVVAVGTQVVGRLQHRPWRSLEVGGVVVFAVLFAVSFVADDLYLQTWIQPLGNLGILLISLVGVFTGHPFVTEYAVDSVDERTARSDGFLAITRGMTWLWIGVFAAMTLASLVPPIVDGTSSLRDPDGPLEILGYWVLPFGLAGAAGVVSGIFPGWFEKRSAQVAARQAKEAPAVAAQPPAPAALEEPGLALDVPQRSRHDEPFTVTVAGVPDGAEVRMSAHAADLYGRQWQATANFVSSGPDGVSSAATPVSGDWADPSDRALVTAMRFASPDRTPEFFVPPPDPWQVTVTADVAGIGTLRQAVQRVSAATGARSRLVVIDGRDGLLVLPPNAEPQRGLPGVVCFGGSEGGYLSQAAHASLLAAHGFAALAATWISEDDAAEQIASVPLERFTAAIAALAGQPEVDASRVAAMAVSRGAEGLLAATAAFPDAPPTALVLVSPSSVSWQAISGDGEVPDTPSWTVEGSPVEWRPLPSGVLMGQLVRNAWRATADERAHRPSLLRLRPAYEAGLARTGPGAIPAARVRVPVMLVAGTDDQVWPSAEMAAEIAALRSNPQDEFLRYRGAGHLIRLGSFPDDALWTGGISLGGERGCHATAEADATRQIIAFLRLHTV